MSKQTEVNELLQMSEDGVAQVNDLLSVLQDSKEVRGDELLLLEREKLVLRLRLPSVCWQDYEHLAAQLDGARTQLAKKVHDFGWVESKIPLVEEAEKHAELLDMLALNLSR